jgi:hypothetical protein
MRSSRWVLILSLAFTVLYPYDLAIEPLRAHLSLSSQAALDCRDLFGDDENPVFRQDRFLEFKNQYRAQFGQINESKWSEKSTEEILAIADIYGSKNGQAFDLSSFLHEASDDDLAKLLKITQAWSKTDQPTGFATRRFFAKLYRLIHQPQTILQWLKSPNGFRERYDDVTDEVVFAHLKAEWSSRALIEVFKGWGVLKSPTEIERFKEFLKNRQNIIYGSLTLALNAASLSHGLPIGIVGKSRVMSPRNITDEEFKLMDQVGFDEALKNIGSRYRGERDWQFRQDLLRRFFNLGVLIVLLQSIPQELAATHTQAALEIASTIAPSVALAGDPEVQAKAKLEEYALSLEKLDPQHRHLDRNSPNMQKAFKTFMDSYSRELQKQRARDAQEENLKSTDH